jgi:hypothetical protein
MTTTKLICQECQRENEAERIFCHGCGARLDRSALATQKTTAENPQDAHQRIRRMFDPHRGRLRRAFFSFCKLLLAACATAAVLQVALPLDVPAPVKSIGVPPQINFDLENAELYHRPAELRYNSEQATAYLGYALKSKQKALDKPLLDFNRALVKFGEGTCTITVERSVFGYALHQRATFAVNVVEGKINAANKGAWIGRLPVHPVIMRYGDIIFADVWSALDRERKLIAKMGAIEFHEDSVVLTAPPQ